MVAPDDAYLQDVKAYFVRQSIHLASRRVKIWTEKLKCKGGEVTQDPTSKGITHVLLGDEVLQAELNLPEAPLVSVRWLEACLAKQKRISTRRYIITPGQVSCDGALSNTEAGPMRPFEHWLGYWKPEFDQITNLTEFVLQAKYSEQNSVNEPLVKLLLTLHKFECAVQDERGNGDANGVETINHKALQYARAASIVRACAFEIGPELADNELPFAGPSTARVIRDLARTGTCHELDAFREGDLVYDSKGNPRPDTVGGNVRRLFKKLPGTGVQTAKAWWEAGCRTYEEIEEKLSSNQILATSAQIFSLEHREDLLEDCPVEDIEDMKAAVLATLHELTGELWDICIVGGARRGTASHDADFVITHPYLSTEGVMEQLVEKLTERGRLVPPSEGMCLVQHGRMPSHIEQLRRRPSSTGIHNLQADRYDRLVGIYCTEGGKYRRMDIIVSPADEVPFCLISWTGSKQWNRFIRQHAINRGMFLNAHRLMREHKGCCWIVPDEVKPSNRDGHEFWPPGWESGRRIKTEADVLELLEVPWREAWERNCP